MSIVRTESTYEDGQVNIVSDSDVDPQQFQRAVNFHVMARRKEQDRVKVRQVKEGDQYRGIISGRSYIVRQVSEDGFLLTYIDDDGLPQIDMPFRGIQTRAQMSQSFHDTRKYYAYQKP